MLLPIAIISLLLSSLNAFTGPAIREFASPETQVTLLELYTSEGCSSCPPAETWLSRLREEPRLWQDVVPIAWHVNYWDNLGWLDSFAQSSYTDRQRYYTASWQSGSIYTPGFVMNGQEWRGWSKMKELELAPGDKVGRLRVTVEGSQAQALFIPSTPLADELEIHLAILGFDLVSDVKAGENRNRTLHHDFTVLAWEWHALARQTDGAFSAHMAMPPISGKTAKHYALAAWIAATTHPQPLQAVGGWLNSLP